MVEHSIDSILEKSLILLRNYPLCSHCLGRQFAWLSTDTSNLQRGTAIKLILSMTAEKMLKAGKKEDAVEIISILAGNGMFNPAMHQAEKNSIRFQDDETCYLCSFEGQSVFQSIDEIAETMIQKAEAIEFESFLVGSIPAGSLVDLEDELRANYDILHGEPLKSDLNRELGKAIFDRINKEVEFERPDLVFIYDMEKGTTRLQINPIFIYGRYRKLERGIPQSRWDCNDCQGRGCEECNNTGRRYPDSIGEYIGIPFQRHAASSRFKFHAAGREDVDVLMLGAGRPFVIELSKPKVRTLDLRQIQREIALESKGKVEVQDLEMTRRDRGQKLKEEASSNLKEYTAIIEVEEGITDEQLREVEAELKDVDIQQRTPNRVAHRRSDLVRKKHVYEVKLSRRNGRLVDGFFRVQGGTYIKELISGDEGRTEPSISGLLGVNAVCVRLDVTAIISLSPHHNA